MRLSMLIRRATSCSLTRCYGWLPNSGRVPDKRAAPPREPSALDIDVLIAAQALLLSASDDIVIATTNPKHLAQFIAAQRWDQIQP